MWLLCPLVVVLLAGSPGSRAADVSRLVFGSFRNFLPAAFGDYNGDKQTDLFVLDPDQRAVEVLLAFHQLQPIMHRRNLRCVYSNLTIRSVVPSDFDGDGAMDVLLVGREDAQGDPRQLIAFVLWGQRSSLGCVYNATTTIRLLGEPLAIDYNGDMITDLLGRAVNGSRAVWVFDSRRTARVVYLDAANAAPLRLPHTSAFVDADGDLAADLVLAVEAGYEVWRHEPAGWRHRRTFPSPAGAALLGQAVFFDLDCDGRLDQVLPVCYDAACANSSLLLERDGDWKPLLMETEDSVNGQWGFVPPADVVYERTVTPRVGDFNLDGFPDLLVSLQRKDGGGGLGADRRTLLLENVPCPPDAAACPLGRGFSARWDTFRQFPASVAAAFYDIGDDGLLDALIVQHADGQYTVSAERNSPNYDALFLKLMVLDGGCSSNCSEGRLVPYGTNRPGPAARGQMTLTDGSLRTFAAAQLSQSAHHALQLPYTVFGLGRSPNFVDELRVGVPSVDGVPGPLTSQWTQLIPNSQVVIVPRPPAQPSSWTSKLYVTPGQTIVSTLAALLGTLLITLLIIGLLHWRERRQDRRERLQEAHRFNFDAM